MKSFKKGLKIASVVVMSAAIACGVTACGGNDHTHKFAEGYSYNEQTHWHPCEVNAECGAKRAEKEHDFVDGVCSVCNYEEGKDLGGATGGLQPGGNDDNTGGTGSGGGGGTTSSDDPTIPKPVAGKPVISKASKDELETAYVEWTAGTSNATWYEVYCKESSASNWVKLDNPLIRQYSDYYRADALGLKAGTYDMKVVPVDNQGGASEAKSVTVTGIAVQPQDRSGYAFTSNHVPGAYNSDGTLKTGAQVLYITKDTAKTITATVYKAGKPNEATGFQSIIDGRQASKESDMDNTPLCFRIVGTVNRSDLDHISSSAEGLQIKGTKNITLEGVGNDGTINGFGMLIRNCIDIEVKNLGIVNFMDDGVSVDTDNSYLWMHNLDIFYGNAGGDSDQAKGDGSLDIKKSTYCTVSYNHFWDSGKCCLLDAGAGNGSNYMTYHHNWFDHSDSRHVRVRNASAVHIYNNYYDGNAKYGIGSTTGSSTFAENNYFRSTSSSTHAMMIAAQGTDAKGDGTFSGEPGGMIKGYGNKFDMPSKPISHKTAPTDFDYYEADTRDEQVTIQNKSGTSYSNFDTKSDFYEYTVHSADDAKAMVEKYAGRVGGGDLQYEFNDAVEDANYGIISELKSMVTNYKTSVVKIGGEEVGSGTTGGTTGGTTTGGDSGTTGGESGGTTGGNSSTIDGEVTFIPSASGSGFTVEGTTKSHSAITVAGVNIAKNSALKMNSSGKVTFDTTEEMTLYLYLLNENSVKVDGTVKTLTAEGSYYVVSLKISAGSHTIVQGSGENALYLIKLVPVS